MNILKLFKRRSLSVPIVKEKIIKVKTLKTYDEFEPVEISPIDFEKIKLISADEAKKEQIRLEKLAKKY